VGEFIRNRGGGAWEHRKSGLAGAEAGKNQSPFLLNGLGYSEGV